MITEDYVSYEIAQLLKEKGFDEPCTSKYCTDGSFDRSFCHYKNSEINKDAYNAPTHQMAMRWLREKDIRICPDYSNVDGKWFTMIGTKKKRTYSGYYDTYEEAIEAALKYSLENLI